MEKKIGICENKLFRIMTTLLAIAAVTTTVAYFIFRSVSNNAHKRKWRDYDDCGLA
ncbi:MAG: hypothetical protein FWH14_07270 [Oscillospiraceae bacterium]|nr:hypothetical protein [Oscillospiraceae bacterium]